MGSIFQRYRQILILALLLIYTLAQILSAGVEHRHQRNWMERLLVAVTAPPQKLCTYFIDRINSLRLGYIYLVDARRNYEQLQVDHRLLVARLHELEEAEIENGRLRTMLGFRQRTSLRMVPARVIALGTSTFTHSLRLDKGSSDNLKERMSVVTADGIVGHIISVTDNYADVLLLPDPNSSIDALDQQTRSRGIVQGQGTNELRLDFIPRDELIDVGHTLISTGLDGIYPKGLPIGTITHKSHNPASIFMTATLKPAVNFSRLEEVLVVTGVEQP